MYAYLIMLALAAPLSSFTGDWTYARGIMELYSPEGQLIQSQSVQGKTYTFKKSGNRIVTTPKNGGTTLYHALNNDVLTIAPQKQKKCLDVEEGYCCSVHIVDTYTLTKNDMLLSDIQYGFTCDGTIKYVIRVSGTLVRED